MGSPDREPATRLTVRRYLIIAAAGVAVLGAGVLAFTPNAVRAWIDGSPRLVAPGGASVSVPTPERSYSFGTVSLCLDRPGSVTIEKVVAEHPYGGLRVVDFALGIPSLGASPVGLRQDGYGSDRRVRVTCKANRGDSVLAVQVRRPTSATAGAPAFVVTYRSSAGDERTVRVHFRITLCAPRDHSTEGCHSA